MEIENPPPAGLGRNAFFTVDELADWLKVNPETIRRMVKRKQLEAIRIGRAYRIQREWIERWLRRNTMRDTAGEKTRSGAAGGDEPES
ncbi:MAG: Helix-turn-helix domain protein [candidate division BRC1 bacterium ADurb.BinA364]|nr:MAG: Helix-turn-helix domain protein [candidate division BRC1 bacterium ADurb.BinA364]